MTQLRGLDAGVPIVDSRGAPTPQFLIYMQQITSGLANSSGASMPTPAPVVIQTDYTGAILTGELPRDVQVQRLLNGNDVSARTRWFLTVPSGITASIDQGGVITITAITAPDVQLAVKSVRDGVTLTCNVEVQLGIGSAPTSGSGGGTGTTFNTINSTSYAAITSDISVTVGSSGTVNLSAPLTVSTSRTDPTGTFPVWGKWQWYNGSSWVDVAAEVKSSPDAVVDEDTVDTTPPKIVHTLSKGLLTVNTPKTGLTVGSSQKFHLMARNDSGTRTMTFSGSASVTTS